MAHLLQRLTIGVELGALFLVCSCQSYVDLHAAAHPDFLLFLDERGCLNLFERGISADEAVDSHLRSRQSGGLRGIRVSCLEKAGIEIDEQRNRSSDSSGKLRPLGLLCSAPVRSRQSNYCDLADSPKFSTSSPAVRRLVRDV